MHLDLNLEESRFLVEQLRIHLERLTNELIHTDDRDMQRSLSLDEQHVRAILAKLESEMRS